MTDTEEDKEVLILWVFYMHAYLNKQNDQHEKSTDGY